MYVVLASHASTSNKALVSVEVPHHAPRGIYECKAVCLIEAGVDGYAYQRLVRAKLSLM